MLTVLVTRTAKGNRVPKLPVERSQTFLRYKNGKLPSLSLSNKRPRSRIRRLSLFLSFFDFPFYFSGFCFLLTSTDPSLIEILEKSKCFFSFFQHFNGFSTFLEKINYANRGRVFHTLWKTFTYFLQHF